MELNFSYSNIAVYRIVEFERKKYILDAGTVKGKSYFIGMLPEEVTAEMVELSSDSSFKIKSKTQLGITTLAVMVQPLVHLIYNQMETIFIDKGISQQILLKLGIFAFSMFLSYLLALFYEKKMKGQMRERIPTGSKRYKLTFRPDGERRFEFEVMFVLNAICLAIFMSITNGTEGAALVINGIISWFYFVMMKMPQLDSFYRNKKLILEKIEEI